MLLKCVTVAVGHISIFIKTAGLRNVTGSIVDSGLAVRAVSGMMCYHSK